MVIFVSLLAALVGVLMYALCANTKLARIGEILFACGVLAFLLQLSPKMIGLFGG